MEANSRMPLGPGLTSPDDKENSTPNKMNTSRSNSRSESAQALKTTNTNGTDHDKSVAVGAKSRESLARNLQLASQDPNPAVRKAAQSALISAEEENYPKFILALVDLMAAPSRNEYVCQLAGLHVKNLLVANDNDGALQTKKHDKWMAIPPITRRAIQSNLLNAIRSPVCGTRNTAVLVGSEIAAIEIPDKEWLEFPSVMMENVTREGGDDGIKISSLHCIRMMYRRTEELMGEIPPEVTDLMLTTIADGMRSNRPDPIRYAATRALGNSLSFARKNMENPAERDVILKMICEATKSADADVRSAANECIVQIAFQYYDKLQAYMQTLSQLTLATIRSDEAKVALQAIELWSTLAEKEMELNDMAAKLAETGQSPPPESVCFGYVSAASDELVPILAELLTRQDEEAEIDDDQWNPSMSGATCLQLVANTVKDAIVPRIMPFVRQHIQSNNWRYKEAAVMAISSILNGPSDDAIGPCVNQSISFVLTALSDPNVLVKDTAAWAIGRMCHLQGRLIPVDIFPTLVNGLAGKLLTETPRVSSKVCIGIYNLAAAQNDSAAATSGTNALSPYMAHLLQTLLLVVDRDDATESNLRIDAFVAMTGLIKNAAPDATPLLLDLEFLPAIIERLAQSLIMSALPNKKKEQREGVQGLLCGLIQVLSVKMTKEELLPYCDAIMTNFFQVLQTKNATCHEEALSASSAIAIIIGRDFFKYTEAMQPHLISGLRNFEAYQVCTEVVELVGDISRAIEGKMKPYCDEIMCALVEALQNPTLHHSVKPLILSCFGDIALATTSEYEPYLETSLKMVLHAAKTCVPDDDDDRIHYVIIEAYTGIILGLKDGNRTDLLLPYVNDVFSYLEMIMSDDSEVLSKAEDLRRDIAIFRDGMGATGHNN